jgi:glycosyltransferase involved in cell wall biosynthesis
LCKTEYARRVLRDSFDLDSRYIGFTTPPGPPPAGPPPRPDARLVAHFAGTSGMKGTLAVLRAWVEHGGLALPATLFVTRQPSDFARAPADLAYWEGLAPDAGVSYLGIPGLERHGNVYLARRVLDAAEFARVAAAAMTQLCPSVAEGFGHSINGARAAGAVVIAPDAPPMNELIGADCGLLVPAAPGPPMAALNPTQRANYPPAIAALESHAVAPADLMAATARALALSATDRARLSANARGRYADGRARFTAALAELVALTELGALRERAAEPH